MYQDFIQQGQEHYQAGHMHEILGCIKALHLETAASDIGLPAGLLQVGDGMNCGGDKVLNNTALHPICEQDFILHRAAV